MMALLKKSFLFIVTSLVVYLLLFAFLFYFHIDGTSLLYRATTGFVMKGGGTYLKTHQFNTNEMHDVVIVGSSHAYRGYNPAIFNEYGYNAFNLGTSDQKMMCTFYLTKNYINHRNCKILLLDLYDRVFSQENIESYSDLIQNMPSDKAAFDIMLASKDVRTINMITLRYFNKNVPPNFNDTSGYFKGFMATDKYMEFPLKHRVYKYERNEESLHYLEKLLSYLQTENIKPVMAEHALPSLSPAPDHAKFRADILPVLKKYNVQWFDYTNDTTMNDFMLFADESHLNIHGVKIYNHRLIDDMIAAGILPEINNTSLVDSRKEK